MNKLRKVTAIGCVAAFAAFGVAACGGDSSDSSSSSSSGSGGGDVNVTMSSFPDYVDPQLSYTVEGWETLYNVYTPPADVQARQGRRRHRGRTRSGRSPA